jgi:hypothetical protein
LGFHDGLLHSGGRPGRGRIPVLTATIYQRHDERIREIVPVFRKEVIPEKKHSLVQVPSVKTFSKEKKK